MERVKFVSEQRKDPRFEETCCHSITSDSHETFITRNAETYQYYRRPKTAEFLNRLLKKHLLREIGI